MTIEVTHRSGQQVALHITQPPVVGVTTTAVAVPVSYTHLRAHETVLDLVCRLLLEKKNNHKQVAKNK